MTINLNRWPRPRFEPGGGDAFLFFAIYGQFPAEIQVSGEAYRTAGVPGGLSLRRLNRAESPEFPFTRGPIGELLLPKRPELFAEIQRVPECLVFQGTVPDPPDLNYLRDTIGLLMYFLDHGGVGVMDPMQFTLHDATTWRSEIFDPAPPQLHRQAVILCSKEAGNTKWIHTRGLRKFGRPDLSMHRVPSEHETAAIELFNRFILLQAEGGRIREGEQIQMAGLPSALTCRHCGSLEDPDFNNVHVELGWDSGLQAHPR